MWLVHHFVDLRCCWVGTSFFGGIFLLFSSAFCCHIYFQWNIWSENLLFLHVGLVGRWRMLCKGNRWKYPRVSLDCDQNEVSLGRCWWRFSVDWYHIFPFSGFDLQVKELQGLLGIFSVHCILNVGMKCWIMLGMYQRKDFVATVGFFVSASSIARFSWYWRNLSAITTINASWSRIFELANFIFPQEVAFRQTQFNESSDIIVYIYWILYWHGWVKVEKKTSSSSNFQFLESSTIFWEFLEHINWLDDFFKLVWSLVTPIVDKTTRIG